MAYNALRKGRASIPAQIYLVTTVTRHRQRLFEFLPVGRIVVNSMRMLDEASACRTLAFVVMPDHVHWLLELGDQQTLMQVVKLMKGRSATAIGRYLGRSAPVWQPSFHDHAVRSDESLVDVARYVVMNPVRAGLVTRPGNYSLWDSIWL